MRITEINIFKADLPLVAPFRIATMEVTAALNVFVRIATDSGLVGFGEANPYWRIVGETQETVLAACVDFAKILLGRDPLETERRAEDLGAYLARNFTAKSACEMALHDIAAQAAGLPLCRFLGGAPRTFTTDRTVGLDAPEKMVADALRFHGRGFPAIKLKVGRTADVDVAVVRGVREAIGAETPIRIDANQAWDVTTALATLRRLEPFGIEYCEQPVPAWNVAGMAEVRRGTCIPIMADEAVFDAHDALMIIGARASDFINVKLAKCGGVSEALAIDAIARAAGIPCMLGCMTESRLALSAAAHIVCARPQFSLHRPRRRRFPHH